MEPCLRQSIVYITLIAHESYLVLIGSSYVMPFAISFTDIRAKWKKDNN